YTLLGFLFFFVRDSLNAQDVRMETALLFLTFTCVGVLGAALAARPTDRGDRRIVVSVANGIVALALFVFAAAHSSALAFYAAAVAGLGWGAFYVADWSLACRILPDGAMATAMGVWNFGATIPQIIAPVVTSPIVLWFNARSSGLGPRAAM